MNVLLRILLLIKGHQLRLMGALVCSVGVAGLTAVYAWLVQPVLDGIFIQKDQMLLLLLPFGLLAVSSVKGLFAYGQAYLMSYVGNRVVADVRQRLFGQLVRLPLGFHEEHSSGRLVARITNDVNQMGNAIPNVFKDLLQQGLTFLGLVGYVFYLNWKLASVLLVVVPVSFFAIVRIGKRLRKLATRGQEYMGDMTAVLKEAFSGIKIVKAYGREHREAERFDTTNTSFMRASIKSAQLSAIASPLMEVIAVSGVAIIIWYGGHLVISNAMTPGAFFSFLTAMFMAYAPIRRLAGANASIQTAIAAAHRVFEMLDLEHEQQDDSHRKILPFISEALEFKHVDFSYHPDSPPALLDISLRVTFGEIVALVGSSGSGKTTLASLVPRFYSPTHGAIYIDGQNIEEVTLASLRGQIAIVSQDTMLFDDSVRGNIAYGRLNATDEEILAAATAANAMEFIDRLPRGMDTMIGENGVKLSGGQRQRLAIARAILRDPPLLILDEATSSLDSESERVVQEALIHLMKNRTTLVIAHRLSTVLHADRIVVLSHGRILETGTHAELIKSGGVYKKLYLTQFQDVDVESVIP